MESISLPKNILIDLDKENEYKGVLTIGPLYPGYGPTVANSLRRVLLSSMPGAAIYAFKTKGVSHEFTSIDYVKEDVVDISLNLKRVNLKSHSEEPVELKLKVTGEKVVTAGDIEANSDVEIANPDQVIMTLTDKAADIDMSLWVKKGRGYETVESREKGDEEEVNVITVDSIFTPIHEVGYQVDNVRVGVRTDYDKITMQIETNKTVSIEEAVKDSANLLAEHFKLISESSFDEKEEEMEVVEAEESDDKEDADSTEEVAEEKVEEPKEEKEDEEKK
jgi:DNA-directed RNA polymerase subunit alpha